MSAIRRRDTPRVVEILHEIYPIQDRLGDGDVFGGHSPTAAVVDHAISRCYSDSGMDTSDELSSQDSETMSEESETMSEPTERDFANTHLREYPTTYTTFDSDGEEVENISHNGIYRNYKKEWFDPSTKHSHGLNFLSAWRRIPDFEEEVRVYIGSESYFWEFRVFKELLIDHFFKVCDKHRILRRKSNWELVQWWVLMVHYGKYPDYKEMTGELLEDYRAYRSERY